MERKIKRLLLFIKFNNLIRTDTIILLTSKEILDLIYRSLIKTKDEKLHFFYADDKREVIAILYKENKNIMYNIKIYITSKITSKQRMEVLKIFKDKGSEIETILLSDIINER